VPRGPEPRATPTLPCVKASLVVKVVSPQIARKCVLSLCCEVIGWFRRHWHLARPSVVHDGSDREVGRAAEKQHDHHTEYDGGLAELALCGAAETEIVTAARISVCALLFPSAHVGCDGCPRSEPEEDGEGVEGGRGVDVGEACGAGPHGRHDKVDQDWDGEPALGV